MIRVNDLVAYGQGLQNAVQSINYNQTVVDDSQLVDQLDQVSPEENHLLLLVIPSFDNRGRDGGWQRYNRMMFLVLQKADRSITHDEFLQIMHDTQLTVEAVEKQMYDDYESCNKLMQFLDVESVQINPIWGFASCHGWSIEFSVKTPLFM